MYGRGVFAVSILLSGIFSSEAGSGNIAARNSDSEKDWGRADVIAVPKVPDVSPVSRDEMITSFRRGADFLLRTQNENGSWGDHTGGGNWSIWSPYSIGPRTFRTASTALCITGLESSPLRDDPKIQEAIQKAEDFLLEEMPKLKRSDSRCVYASWANAYVLEALCIRGVKLHKESERYKKIKECAELQIKCLNEQCSPQGGWGYIVKNNVWTANPNATVTSFMSATVLTAVKRAEDVFGIKLRTGVHKRAIKFLKSQRTPAGTYLYSETHRLHPSSDINRHPGSLARSPACDLAIWLYEPDKISLRQMNDGIERLWSRKGWLEMALKKPKPHESFAQNSGYFYYYGYYYVSLCLDVVPHKVVKRHASHLTNDLIPRQEKDGSWWDNQLYNYHKYYGTGYALTSLGKAWEKLYDFPAE